MQGISPFLWFDTQAEEAAKFYTSIFRNARMGRVARYPEGTPGKASSVMTVSFALNGQEFVALNGGPAVQCGWLTDKYGVSWQIVPVQMIDMFADRDTAKTRRVAEAMMKMVKLDLPALQRAYQGP